MAALGHKYVGRLNVAMDDALAMGSVQGIGDFDGQSDQNILFQRAFRRYDVQGRAVQKLHGDEWLAVFLADFVDRADVGMVQGGGGLRFALEAGQACGSLATFISGRNFKRDKAMQD